MIHKQAPKTSLNHHPSRISDSIKTMSKKQEQISMIKNKKHLKSNPASSSSYIQSCSNGISVRKEPTNKDDKNNLEVFNNANFSFFPNHLHASISDSFYTGTANSFASNNTNNAQQLQQNQQLQQDPNHIYYQNQGIFTPTNYNENYSSGSYSGQQIQQQQSMQQHMQQQNQCYPGSQQQYYYYPTPESSPDVQFQLLNEAAVLSAATQHLLAGSNSQTSYNMLPNTNRTNNFNNNNGINIAKQSNNSNDVSVSSSSNASSTSPSPSESVVNMGYGNSAVFSYHNTHQTSSQNQPGVRMPNLESQNLTTPNLISPNYQSFNVYPNQMHMESESISSGCGSNSAKNWYLSAAAAAVAAQQSNSLNYQSNSSNQPSNESSSTVNNYNNFQQEF